MKKLIIILLFCPVFIFSQQMDFSADSTYNYIEHLSITIGPRPMGSDNERKALEWAQKKFSSFGADTAFTMKFSIAKTRLGELNTSSGTTVGIFRGKVDSAIVVGGHIDSDDWETPGANDNASGASTALELARIWGGRDRHYTMIFCVFGGEEKGLIGSKYFVDNYDKLNDVELMVSTDMTGFGNVITMFEIDSVQAPKWLVEDAFSIAEEVGLNQLFYGTHYATLNNIGPGGAGSDHIPFLGVGIPAIDFTAGVNESPIHTQMDRLEFIDKEMLGTYGQFVDQLLLKYQKHGIPGDENTEFVLWEVFGIFFYIPIWFIKVVIAISLLLSIYAFIVARKQRTDKSAPEWIKFSAFKLFGLFTVIMIFVHLSEASVQVFSGYRYGWLIHLDTYLWYTVIWSIAGLWTALQITKKWKFNSDPYVYALRFFIILFIYTVLMSLVSARLGAYPAIVLLLLALAIVLKNVWAKSILAFLAFIPMFRLVFNEVFPFMSRGGMMGGFMIDNWFKALLFNVLLSVVLLIWFLPLIYAAGFLVVSNPPLKKSLKTFRKTVPGIVIAVIIIGFGAYLLSLTAYNEMWRPAINVEAEYDINKGDGKLTVKGNEYFKDVHVKTDSLDQNYDSRIQTLEIPQSFKAGWVKVYGMEEIRAGERDTVDFSWIVQSDKPWIRTTVTVKVDTADIYDPVSALAMNHSDNRLRFVWYGNIPDSLNIKGSLAVEPGAKLIRRVNAVYRDMPIPIEVTSDLATVKYRTKVEYQDTVSLIY